MEAILEAPAAAKRQTSHDAVRNAERTTAAASPRGFLTLQLGQETYCIDILNVQEIRGYSVPTRIADAPPAIKGVVNLRGTIVPVVELRHVFGIAEPCYDAVTATIVVAVGNRHAGLIVDAVADVVDLLPEQVSPPPLIDGAGANGFITGLATVKTDDRSQLYIVLDVARLLASPIIGLG